MSESYKNYYEVLEVPVDSDQDTIYQGYQTTKGAYAHDNMAMYSIMTREECRAALMLIEEAYEILSNPQKRQAYDQVRGLNGQTDATSNAFRDKHGNLFIRSGKNENVDHPSVSKMVAGQRFSLKYEIDPEIEREIENTSDWTGPFLRKIREYKGVDISRLSDMTKISKMYIMAIEEQTFDNLPPTVYIRGFIYQYAKCLKLAPELVCASYIAIAKEARGET